ncbi:dentin sialophosphoprotein-like isoform X2 [Cololabis saira]|uniref:dentin sialophosphoprotein-like isoform X2 n=1 Tax=Cololabis saira TaxID=129043 RepID=UPI002AD34853|nr:dentin sialophosphoprotein-like isoform X2 [Cololabis saira]
MAAPTESLLSLGHLTGTERSTFTKQRKPIIKKRPMLSGNEFPNPTTLGNIKVKHLQLRWQELQERERIAQQHNRQLLQQFEEAQDALEDMLARNAAMKTIRTEYERYLEENFQRWQQQLTEKTQAAQKKRMDDCLRSNLKKTEEERVPKPTVEGSLLFQGPSTSPPRHVAPQVHSIQDYHQDSCSHHPYMQSWLTHSEPQTGRFPVRGPYQAHNPSLFLPPNFIQPHPFLFHHHASPTGHNHPWSRTNAAGWPSPQQPYLWPWGAGAAGVPPGSWGELCTEEPPPELRASQYGQQQDGASRAQSSKKESSGGSCLCQELDIKPVRLSSGRAESSGSGRDSSLTSSEKRKRRDKSGITHHSSSDRERCGSQQSSTNSSEIIIVSQAVAQSVDRDRPTEEGGSSRTKRRAGFTVGSPRTEKVAKEPTQTDGGDSQSYNEDSQKVQTSTGAESGSSTEESREEKEGNRALDDKSGSSRTEEESESEGVKTEDEAADEAEKEEISVSEQSSTEEKHGGHKHIKALEQEEYSQKSGEQEDSDVEEDDDDDVSEPKNTTEEEAEDKMEEQGNDEHSNKLENKKDSSSSLEEDVDDEEGSEGSEEEEVSNEEGDEEEEEHRSDEAQEDDNTDSNDSIISPQEKRQIIPEKVAENAEEDDEEEAKTGSSTDHSNKVSDDDDIENLLAPQEQTKKKEENDVEADGNTKATCHNMDIFQVTEDRLKDYRSDSDEIDDFYD